MEPSIFQIRRAMVSDAAELWLIRTLAIEAISTGFCDKQRLTRWSGVVRPSVFDDAIRQWNVLVGEHDGRIVGWGFIDEATTELEGLIVDPAWQRRGIARRTYTELEHAAREAGLRSLFHFATLNAFEFYESVGFVRVQSSIFHHPEGFELACFVMSKQLG